VVGAIWTLDRDSHLGWLKSWWTNSPHGRKRHTCRQLPRRASSEVTEMRDQQIEPGVYGLWRQSIVIPKEWKPG